MQAPQKALSWPLRRRSVPDVIQVKPVYNPRMTVFRYGREHFEEGEYVRRVDASPGNELDPVVRIVEDLGTVEIPCGKVDCRSNCIEYMVSAKSKRDPYTLAECKVSSLVSII
jgi:hypothetical protein